MPQTNYDRIIALAGIFQATHLVHELAFNGQAEPQDFATCIGSLLKIDAATSEDVYEGLERLESGLSLVIQHLRNPKNVEITRYVISLLVLERKLTKHPLMLQQIREGLETTMTRLDYFPLTHDNTIAALADIYTSTISTLTPRIMVNGDPMHLNNPDNANRIRTLLLAGIRGAILWRQNGGGRLTLILKRKGLLQEAQRMLSTIPEDDERITDVT
jgi:high frequency lysogenization protein